MDSTTSLCWLSSPSPFRTSSVRRQRSTTVTMPSGPCGIRDRSSRSSTRSSPTSSWQLADILPVPVTSPRQVDSRPPSSISWRSDSDERAQRSAAADRRANRGLALIDEWTSPESPDSPEQRQHHTADPRTSRTAGCVADSLNRASSRRCVRSHAWMVLPVENELLFSTGHS